MQVTKLPCWKLVILCPPVLLQLWSDGDGFSASVHTTAAHVQVSMYPLTKCFNTFCLALLCRMDFNCGARRREGEAKRPCKTQSTIDNPLASWHKPSRECLFKERNSALTSDWEVRTPDERRRERAKERQRGRKEKHDWRQTSLNPNC